MTGVADVDSLRTVRDWLRESCGIHYPDRKFDLFRQRMDRVLRQCEISDYDELARRLVEKADNGVRLATTHAASTNHTFFFREQQILDVFRDEILPSLAVHDDIRIWSAASSTGDEAYTLAIIAAEAMGMTAAQKKLAILGTDISAPVVAQSETGVYGPSHLGKLPADLRARYFSPVGMQQYQVAQGLRRICTFRRMNLKALPYPFQKQFHTIFCRNILYYFDRDTQRQILMALYQVTVPGGWLLTSVTESVRDLKTDWQPVSTGVYRKPG
ncbi:chemotaxis protein methyltransferase CheR [Rhodovulum bhavnagarense]|uniref:protein-glutamate O-methyltransferase n=1 Tax=Rhodovulum bhavnagarense TaxID=992286 RepID=A0A4R2REU5_9RHOB|nr:protein-glutamate O-methyltransferase CheR [Rhodovulum bhavnagarense]TCP61373.1 chemotaxis protein methyltransferase CheR [Rhodovulum bhavnagarense]